MLCEKFPSPVIDLNPFRESVTPALALNLSALGAH